MLFLISMPAKALQMVIDYIVLLSSHEIWSIFQIQDDVKSVTLSITYHSHKYGRKWLHFAHVVHNIYGFKLTKVQVKWCDGFLTWRISRNRLFLVARRKSRTISSTPQRLWQEISWSIPTFSLQGVWAFSRPLAKFPTRIRLAMTDQHPKS